MSELSTRRLSTIEIFCKAAELGSFARTAEVLGLNPSAVSKAISRLEKRLSVKLFHRTTRSLRLTEAGQLFFERCQQALGDIAEAEASVTQSVEVPRGTLRVSLPNAYSVHVLAPRLHHFYQQYPEIELQLDVSDRFVDLVEENIDIAIRFGKLVDSNLTVRPLQAYRTVTVASPNYLQRCGTPKNPEDLHNHNCIQLIASRSRQPMKWKYWNGQTYADVPVQGSHSVVGADTARILAIHGIGITHLSEFVVAKDIETGVLQPVLPAIESPVRNAFALYKQRQHISHKTQLFLDFLA